MSGYLIYKCRKCGGINKNIHVPDVINALTCITADLPLPKNWGAIIPKMTDIHCCSENELGVADLIGTEADKK